MKVLIKMIQFDPLNSDKKSECVLKRALAELRLPHKKELIPDNYESTEQHGESDPCPEDGVLF